MRRILRPSLLVLVLLLTLLLPALAGAATLGQRVVAAIHASGLAASTSVYVWEQGSGTLVATSKPDRRVAPASNMKLLTGAAALAHFGPDHTFTTTIAQSGELDDTTWHGDVYLVGGGDPMLSTLGFTRDNYRGVGTNLGTLVAPLVKQGIDHIDGDIVVVDSLLDRQRFVAEWPRRFRFDEAGALGGLTVNQSRIGRWVGGRSTRTPELFAGGIYRTLIERAGIEVSGVVRRGNLPADATAAGTVESRPLSDILGYMDRTSDNFTAELLLKDLGRDRFGDGHGSTDDGRRAAARQLADLGVDTTELRWIDASGLSYSNRVTARLLGRSLQLGAATEWGPDWVDSFAVSGTSGTIRRRMTHWPYRGRVHAKTGTIGPASALSGFSDRLGSTKRYGFAVVTWNSNGHAVSYSRARALQDRIAMILVR